MSNRADTDLLNDIREAIQRIQSYLGDISYRPTLPRFAPQRGRMRPIAQTLRVCAIGDGDFVRWLAFGRASWTVRWQLIRNAIGRRQ